MTSVRVVVGGTRLCVLGPASGPPLEFLRASAAVLPFGICRRKRFLLRGSAFGTHSDPVCLESLGWRLQARPLVSPSKKVLIMCPFICNFMKVSPEPVKKVEKPQVAMTVWLVSRSAGIGSPKKGLQRFQPGGCCTQRPCTALVQFLGVGNPPTPLASPGRSCAGLMIA